jgi:hypothetical protein
MPPMHITCQAEQHRTNIALIGDTLSKDTARW